MITINSDLIKLLLFIMMVIAIVLGIGGTWQVVQERQENLKGEIVDLEVDGCDPSEQNTHDIIVLQQDVKYIRGGVDRIQNAMGIIQPVVTDNAHTEPSG